MSKYTVDIKEQAQYDLTAQLKRAVRRNIKRFEGEDFMMVISPKEAEDIRSRYHFGIMKDSN